MNTHTNDSCESTNNKFGKYVYFIPLLLSLTQKNIALGCLKTGCLGSYLYLRDTKWQEDGENCNNEKIYNLYSLQDIIRENLQGRDYLKKKACIQEWILEK
jgi:hypothetical protein